MVYLFNIECYAVTVCTERLGRVRNDMTQQKPLEMAFWTEHRFAVSYIYICIAERYTPTTVPDNGFC